MTTSSEAPAGSPAPAGPAPAGAPPAPRARRAPADLPFAFADAALADALGADRDEPGWLREDRLAAAAAYERLPVETSELYTSYVDFRGADLFAARPYVRTASAPAAPGEIPDGADGIIELREDAVVRLALAPGVAERGVALETLGAALARDAAGIRGAITSTALPADEKLAWLSRGFWGQGIHLHVPAGVVLERPIVLRWSAGTADRALLTRTLIRLDEGAEVALVEELVEPAAGVAGDGQALFGGTSEIDLGPGAVLRFASIQDLATTTTVLQQRTARIGAGATLRFAIAHLGGRVVRSRIDNRLEGDGSEVEQVEIVFGGRDQLFDLTAYTRHVGQDTTGNLLSKAVLQHGARAYVKGLISIEKSARGTDSFLGEFGMLLDKQSRSVTIPSLEIDQPDCRRAGHASSVGPIDPAQLFYLESRGITPDEARKFITLGFLEPVVARVPLEAEQERLWAILEAKWAESKRADAAPAA
jgi:Fe-S cluster assembly protein SufD